MKKLNLGDWRFLLLLYALIALCFFFPYVSRSQGDTIRQFTGYDMLIGADSAMTPVAGEDGAVAMKDARKKLLDENGVAKQDQRLPLGLILLFPIVEIGMILLDRGGKRKHWVGMALSLAGLGASAWLLSRVPALYHLPDGYAASETPLLFEDRLLFPFHLNLVLYALGFAACCLGAARKEEQVAAERLSAHLLTRIGVLSAIASVLSLIPGIPIIPPIYKLDFSTVPAMLGGFAMGWGPGLWIVLIKNLIGLFNSSSMYVGELADFLVSGAFVVLSSIIYARRRTLKGALVGMLAGIGAMVVFGALTNYLILIPVYVNVIGMPLDSILGSIAATIPAVNSMFTLILYATMPFNLLKGFVLCLVTMILYKRLSPLLKSSSK